MKIRTVICFALYGLVACSQAEQPSGSSYSNSSIDVSGAADENCQVDNSDLQAMPIVDVSFKLEDDSVVTSTARLANNNRTRAAGFQRVCASTIAAMPILFVFQLENEPRFHMNNVVAPIDIAFIDKKGRIESIQAMQPYSMLSIKKPLYGPSRPVIAAFEAHPGFFKKHNISFKSRFSWDSPVRPLSR